MQSGAVWSSTSGAPASKAGMGGALVALAFGALIATGCAATREAAWETTLAVPARTDANAGARRAELLREGDELWAERLDERALGRAIAKWREAAELDPSDFELWAKLAHAYYFHADGHMSFETARAAEMIRTYEAAMEAAERGLMAVSADFAERMRADTHIEDAIAILDERAVPALYWRSSAMGRWGLAKGFETVLAYKDEIRAIMTRCLELDANYFYGAPHRYFGAYYARVPDFAGGDMERSRQHFEAALRIDSSYLGTRVLMAEFYATRSQDRALFNEQLNLVLSADPAAAVEIAPENAIEQRRARDLLARERELFE
jgi:tetratricopeptide (TPR) repeat protein